MPCDTLGPHSQIYFRQANIMYWPCRNAHAIALFLESHEAVTKVLYPGLPSHPQHEIAKRQQHGFGAMMTFYCIGGRDQSAAVLKNVSPPPFAGNDLRSSEYPLFRTILTGYFFLFSLLY